MVTEAALVHELVVWLMAQGYRVRAEVANMGQSADVVAIRGRWVTVLEAKLVNWRRAIAQCHAHEAVADFIALAVASRDVSPELRRIAEERGYGIVHRDAGRLCWVCVPKRNPKVWAPQRKYWAKHVRKVEICQ